MFEGFRCVFPLLVLFSFLFQAPTQDACLLYDSVLYLYVLMTENKNVVVDVDTGTGSRSSVRAPVGCNMKFVTGCGSGRI